MRGSIADKQIQKILVYLLALVVIVQGTSQYIFLLDGMWFILAFGILAGGLIAWIFFTTPFQQHRRQFGRLFLALGIVLFIHILFTLSMQKNQINSILTFTLPVAIWICYNAFVDKEPFDFLTPYSDCMVVLAFISLFFWLFGQQLQWLPYFRVATQWRGPDVQIPTYYFAHFVSQTWQRNCGIFTEAPMYVFHLSIALAWKLWAKKQWVPVIILAITLVTCFSTMANIVAVTLIVWHIIHTVFLSTKYSKTKKYALIALLALCWIAVVAASVLTKRAEDPITQSYSIRQEHIVDLVAVSTDNLLFGTGFNSIISASNSWFLMLAEQGILMTGLYAAALGLCALRALKEKRADLFMLAGTVGVTLFTISILNREITYYMFTAAWVYGLGLYTKKPMKMGGNH